MRSVLFVQNSKKYKIMVKMATKDGSGMVCKGRVAEQRLGT